MNFKLIAAMAAVSLITTFYLVDNKPKNLSVAETTIEDWQMCIERTMIQTCDLDDPQDRADCYNTASNAVKCYSESSPEASQACTHWWIYFESSKSDDILPDSFFQCSQDCLVFAKDNNFYFQQYFSPMWITCALPDSRPY